jgi:PEP-CTERM motif
LVAYENGGSLGTTSASNTDLKILEGWGETSSFGTTNADREANVSVIYSAVPEPSTWAMMILGFFGVGFMAYRRRNSAVLSA